MIPKCLAVVGLALLVDIGAFKYNEDSFEYSMSNNYKYCCQPTQEKCQRYVTPASKSSPNQNQNIGYMKPINTAPVTRTLVARGKYPVTLQSSGPAPERKIPVVTSHFRAPVQEKPTVRLQAKIPAPKTISHTCTCFKTIIKPKVQQHLITVPTIHRYIETLHRPVVENIHYEAYPVRFLNSNEEEGKDKIHTSQVQPLEGSGTRGHNDKNLGVETFEFPTSQKFEMPQLQSEKNQVVEIPQIQLGEGQKPQTLEIPYVQLIQNKKPHTIEIELPRVQFVGSQKSEGFEIPRTPFFDNKKPQFVELLNAQFAENNKADKVQLPRLEFLQAQKVQTVEIPRIQVEESPKVETVEIPHQEAGISLGGNHFAFQGNN